MKLFFVIQCITFYSLIYSQTALTYTFTNCGATGQNGPTQAQINSGYSGQNPLNTYVISLSGIQQWTVPITSVYRITAYGAQGGAGASTSGGLGASIRGDFTLTAGTVVNLIVGQSGSSFTNGLGGGGGGSFVWLPNNLNQLLIAAGGGGGRSTNTGATESFAGVGNSSTLSTNPTNGSGSGLGGINGNGGNGGSSGMASTYPGGGGGAGWFSNGTNGGNGNINEGNGGTGGISPLAALNPGKGGIGYNYCGAVNVYGGFGGGGAGSGCSGSSGGAGGYNGGGGGNGWNGGTWCSGGGGGSYNSGANIQNLSGVRSGHGLILVQILCNTPALPVLGNTPTALNICPSNSINLTANTTGTINWYSSLNSTTSIGTGSSLITPTLNTGTYTYYVAGSTNTCLPTEGPRLAITVSVHPNPTISITGASTLCSGQTVTLQANGLNTYSWSTGSNSNSIIITPSVSTNYSLNGYSAENCSATPIIYPVTVYSLPLVTISGTNATCSGTQISLSANGANTYTWSNNIVGSSITITPTLNSTYSVNGTDNNGCIGASNPFQITTYSNPLISATSGSICPGQIYTISTTGAHTYTLNGTGICTGINCNFTVSPNSSSIYSISGSSIWGCTSSVVESTVTLYSLPNISISGTNALCSGQSINLTASGANTYTWSTGSNSTGISVSPTSNITYTLSGTNSFGCTGNTASLAVTVNPLPTVSISGTTALCTGQSINLTASGANTYTWSTNSNLSSISVAPTSNTTYTLIGRSTAGCLSAAAASLAVTVYTLPVVSITGTNALCTGQTITLTANGATTYTWSTNSNLGSIAVAPTSNITYSLSGTSAAGCVGSTGATQAVTVYSLPVVSITGTNALCSGQSINLTASGANTYTWSTSSNLNSISVAPLSNITYTLNGTSTAGCISAAAASLAVTVNTLPVVSISGTNALCTGQTITLTAIGATSYSWNHGPLTATCAVNPISNSSFVVTGKTSLGCTSAPATIAISVFSLPIVSINGASTLCAGDNLTLTANGANTYTWFNGSNSSSLILSPPSNTLFTLNGTSSNGCQNLNTSTLSVSVFNRPNITITGTNALCSGQTINLTANGANSYTWSTGSNFNSITISPTINTTYSVSGTNTLGCTSNSLAVLAVNVYSLPIVSIAGTNTICFGQLAQLTAAGANSYTWSNGANTNSIYVSPIANFTYGVIGSNLNGCLSPTVVQSISVYSLPIIIASASSPSICSGGSVTLNATGASSYTWNISPFNPITISPVNTATYTVAGTSPLGCLSQNTAAVSVSVFVTPSVTAGISNSLVCFGRLVSLQANGAASYTWNPSQLTNVPFTATSSVQYTLTGSSIAGCTNTNLATVNLSVMSLPNVQIFGDSAFCFGTTSTLSANGANTYTWNTGSNLNSISITPSITSTYTLIGTALNTCSNIAVKQITVFPLPTVSASISKSVICFGDTVMLSGSGANTYSWTGGAGSGGTLIPTATSSYSLTGYSISGCSSTNVAVVSVTVNTLPIITTGISNPSVCLGQTTSIYANGANSYTWSNGVLNGVAFIPTASAVFTVIGTDANGCTNLAIQNITVHPVPNLSIAASSYSVCEGKQVTLIGQGANTFTWSSGISNGVAFTPSVTSSYTLNGSFNTGCSNTISPVVTVSVFGLPDITISTEKPGICPADSTELFYTGAETYTWIPPLGPGNFIKPKISTSYTVFGTDLWGCQNTSSVLITVHPLPTLQISTTNSMACIGEQVTLKATGAQTYTWNASLVNSEYLFTATTNTQFTLYGSNVFGCLDTTSYNQNIQSCSVALLADLSKSDVSCESRNDASIQVNSTIQPRIPTTQYRIKYKWLGTNQCTSEECTTINALAKGNYTLLMIVTSTVNAHYQRTDTLVKTITINDENPPCNLQPYHGITADFNATNDYFHIDNIDVYPNNSVEIYNRWGERIKRIPYYNNTTNIWPSPDEIGDLQSGTYFYIIFTGDPRVNNLRGWIELLK